MYKDKPKKIIRHANENPALGKLKVLFSRERTQKAYRITESWTLLRSGPMRAGSPQRVHATQECRARMHAAHVVAARAGPNDRYIRDYHCNIHNKYLDSRDNDASYIILK